MSYALALYELAAEQSCEESVYDAALVLCDCLSYHPQYISTISSPVIDMRERLELLSELSQKMPVLLKNTLLLLCEKNEAHSLNKVLDEYIEHYREQKGILNVLIVSAFPIPEDSKAKLKNILGKRFQKEIILELKVNESCLGGLKIQMNGQQYDGSVSRQLEEIERLLFDNRQILC